MAECQTRTWPGTAVLRPVIHSSVPLVTKQCNLPKTVMPFDWEGNCRPGRK